MRLQGLSPPADLNTHSCRVELNSVSYMYLPLQNGHVCCSYDQHCFENKVRIDPTTPEPPRVHHRRHPGRRRNNFASDESVEDPADVWEERRMRRERRNRRQKRSLLGELDEQEHFRDTGQSHADVTTDELPQSLVKDSPQQVRRKTADAIFNALIERSGADDVSDSSDVLRQSIHELRHRERRSRRLRHRPRSNPIT